MNFLQTDHDVGESTDEGDEGKQLVNAAKFGKVERVVQIVSKAPGKVSYRIPIGFSQAYSLSLS